MSPEIYPCILYQRLRLAALRANRFAKEAIWPLADESVEQEGYTVCGLYGDPEFAPPFCGGSETRPGFDAALAHPATGEVV